MAATQFSKEISRFALMSKKECLQDLLTKFSEDTDGHKTIQGKIEDVDKELVTLEKTKGRGGKRKGGDPDKPKQLNGYNRFVKAKLPEISKNKPEMDNRSRMKEVSELWKKMTAEEKAEYNKPATN